jgi:HD superfamily phosphohydrolase
LYKYITLSDPGDSLLEEAAQQFISIGLNPDYHMEIDFPFDQPYDIYRPDAKKGGKEDKAPILLLNDDNSLSEISVNSDIVRSISGLHQGQYHIYYPIEPLLAAAHHLSAEVRELFKI